MIARALAIMGVCALVACTGNELSLSETQQKLVQVTGGNTTFPNTQVGQQSGPLGFYVSAADLSYNTVTAITESCPDFHVVAPSLPQYPSYECNQICNCYDYYCYDPYYPYPYCYCEYYEVGSFSFEVYYTPTVAAQTSCTITVVANTGNYSITVYGTGTPPPAALSAGPGSIGFGEVRRNTTSGAAPVYVTNSGGLPLTINSVTASGAWFSMNTTGGGTVAGGQTATYYAYCTPDSVGGGSGSVSISTSAGSASIPLSCTGIDSNLDLAPSPAAVPVTRVGEPKMQTISVANTGGASMNVESITLMGDPSLSLVGAMPTGGYSPGGSNTVQVQFAADAAGTVNGELRVTYDGGQARTVAISATAQSTAMSVTPDTSHDLGQLCAGSSVTKEFSVIATEAGPFQITDVVPPADPFTLMAPGLPASVQGNGGNTYNFSVGVSPTDAGEFHSEINVTTDIPGGAPRSIMLHAVAIPEGVNGPAEVRLGGAPVGTTTQGQKVSITNCTQAPVTLVGGAIEGPNAALFSVVQAPDDLTLQPGASADWLVVFRPDSGGTKVASFVAQDSSTGASVSVPLTGDGLSEDLGTGQGEESTTPSYYACSTGSASGALPFAIGIAIPLVLRRRRSGR